MTEEKIILYGTPTCPQIPPARGMLQRAAAPFTYIDISRNFEARQKVLEINMGLIFLVVGITSASTWLTVLGAIAAVIVLLGYLSGR